MNIHFVVVVVNSSLFCWSLKFVNTECVSECVYVCRGWIINIFLFYLEFTFHFVVTLTHNPQGRKGRKKGERESQSKTEKKLKINNMQEPHKHNICGALVCAYCAFKCIHFPFCRAVAMCVIFSLNLQLKELFTLSPLACSKCDDHLFLLLQLLSLYYRNVFSSLLLLLLCEEKWTFGHGQIEFYII